MSYLFSPFFHHLYHCLSCLYMHWQVDEAWPGRGIHYPTLPALTNVSMRVHSACSPFLTTWPILYCRVTHTHHICCLPVNLFPSFLISLQLGMRHCYVNYYLYDHVVGMQLNKHILQHTPVVKVYTLPILQPKLAISVSLYIPKELSQ